MSAVNQSIHTAETMKCSKLLNGVLGWLSLMLILYLAWLLCGTVCELFGIAGGQV